MWIHHESPGVLVDETGVDGFIVGRIMRMVKVAINQVLSLVDVLWDDGGGALLEACLLVDVSV